MAFEQKVPLVVLASIRRWCRRLPRRFYPAVNACSIPPPRLLLKHTRRFYHNVRIQCRCERVHLLPGCSALILFRCEKLRAIQSLRGLFPANSCRFISAWTLAFLTLGQQTDYHNSETVKTWLFTLWYHNSTWLELEQADFTWPKMSHGIGYAALLHFGNEGTKVPGIRHLASDHLQTCMHKVSYL